MAIQFLAGQELRRVLAEALIVLGLGVAFALIANLVSPRGLSISRNYFPGLGGQGEAATAPGVTSTPGNRVNETNRANTLKGDAIAVRLKEKGLQSIDTKEAERLFRDPLYEQELTVFIDARDDRHFQDGHIPGAYQFDRYYPERHLPQVLPACLTATAIVVYCTGGTCEDSEFAAVMLKEAGVAQNQIMVYTGGITAWGSNGLPVELGTRASGKLRSMPR
jgi:rhodanese-related sulfurtransferase